MPNRKRGAEDTEPPHSTRTKKRVANASNEVAFDAMHRVIGEPEDLRTNSINAMTILMDVDFATLSPEDEGGAEERTTVASSSDFGFASDAPLSDLSDLTASEEEEVPQKQFTRNHKKQHRKRQVKRVLRAVERAAVQELSESNVKLCAARHVNEANTAGVLGCDASSFSHVSTAWTAPRRKDDEVLPSEVPSHFRLIRCDPESQKATRILDSQRRVIAVVAPGPRCAPEDSWNDVIQASAKAVRDARKKCSFEKEDTDHRRGQFPALAIGITRGPGSIAATTRGAKNTKTQKTLDALVEEKAIRRVAGYQSSLMHGYAPKLGKYYSSTLDAVIDHDPKLKRNFRNSDFASLTVNFGPRTVCKKHRDVLNLAWGWCAVTALGNYDFRKGGHIVLWDLGLVIEFPPGWTVLLPSATVSHSNTPIQRGEKRYSVTQYTGGEVFRWVKNGFRMEKDVPESTVFEKKKRWMDGIGMFSVA